GAIDFHRRSRLTKRLSTSRSGPRWTVIRTKMGSPPLPAPASSRCPRGVSRRRSIVRPCPARPKGSFIVLLTGLPTKRAGSRGGLLSPPRPSPRATPSGAEATMARAWQNPFVTLPTSAQSTSSCGPPFSPPSTVTVTAHFRSPQIPASHVSPVVHPSPSSHACPSATASDPQPVPGTQRSAAHGLPSSQLRGLPEHFPPPQVSFSVQRSPSSQLLPSGFSVQSQPLPTHTGSNVPAAVHFSVALHTAAPTHRSTWHRSGPVQGS